MNNEAFRKLVNSGSVSKSTKEIAREAVELEFRAKSGRKRGRDDDYLSDDDYDNDDYSSGKNRKDKKNGKEEGGGGRKNDLEMEETELEQEEKKNKKQKYRNRARERREGKMNMDYHDSKDISAVDAEMSKYLGGDEAYTHLVKGLDKALAEKVRREEMGQSSSSNQQDMDIDLDQIMEAAITAKNKAARSSSSRTISVENCKINKPSTLSNGMLSYIQNMEERKRKKSSGRIGILPGTTSGTVQTSSAGQSISRSTLQFSTMANIQDRRCSWELPKETMMSMAQYERLYGNKISTCTPLDRNLILKIKSVFSSIGKTRKNNIDRRSKIESSTKTNVAEVVPKKVSLEPVDDSDDDIFGDIGDYVPPSAANK